jgi:hypothetical protein
MIKSNLSERRLLENEATFREINERVQRGFDELHAMAKEDGDQNHYGLNNNIELSFYCECADENCLDRIKMTLDDYQAIHEDNKAFIVVPGHVVKKYEDVTAKESNYWCVRKHKTPPKLTSDD